MSVINDEKSNCIEIIYRSNNFDFIDIFGEDFVKRNKNNCKIIYDGKEYELSKQLEYYKEKKFDKSLIKIKLIGINNITNMSSMFNYCRTLISLSDLSKWDTSKITDMSYIFYSLLFIRSTTRYI